MVLVISAQAHDVRYKSTFILVGANYPRNRSRSARLKQKTNILLEGHAVLKGAEQDIRTFAN